MSEKEDPLVQAHRVAKVAAQARAQAYSAEITRLEKELQRYQSLYLAQQDEIRELRGELYSRLGSAGG